MTILNPHLQRQSQLKTLKSVDLDSSSQLDNEDELSIELRSYKTRVKCVACASFHCTYVAPLFLSSVTFIVHLRALIHLLAL